MDCKREEDLKRIQEMLLKVENEQAPEPIVLETPEDVPAVEVIQTVPVQQPAPATLVIHTDPAPEVVQTVPVSEQVAVPTLEPAAVSTEVQTEAPVAEQTAVPTLEPTSIPTEGQTEVPAPEQAEEQAAAPTEKQTDAPKETSTTEAAPKEKKRKFRLSKGTVFLLVLTECMLLIVALFIFSRSVHLNRDDDIVYADPTQVDTISCVEGGLIVNNVSVAVPVENAKYNISYTWGQDDTDYPTVPHSATASYRNKDGDPLYDISLYRDSINRPADIPEGKDASNWFEGWMTDDSETNLHTPKDSGSLHGFLVSSVEDIEEGATGSTYGSTSYYFALQDEEGVSVYILEGILYDKASLEDYRKVMDDCINSITITQNPI